MQGREGGLSKGPCLHYTIKVENETFPGGQLSREKRIIDIKVRKMFKEIRNPVSKNNAISVAVIMYFENKMLQ